jgi:hypothetical protein
MGYTTLTDRAGRYSFEGASAICRQANIVPRDPPNEVMVLAPRPIRTGHPYDPTEPMPIWAENAEPDTSDIPELDEEWFKKARLVKHELGKDWIHNSYVCTEVTPWDGIARPGVAVLHRDATTVAGKRGCPNCGFVWPPEVA